MPIMTQITHDKIDPSFAHSESTHAPSNAEVNLTTTEMEAVVSHNNLQGVNADEHIDWSLTNIKNVHIDNYTNTTYSIQDGELSQNNLTDVLKTQYDAAEANDTDTALTSSVNVFSVAQRGTVNTITWSAALDINLALSNRFKVTLTGNTTVNLPSNIANAQGGLIYVTQDVTGGWTLGDTNWNDVFKFMDTYTLDTTANVTNVFAYEVFDSSNIIVTYLGSF